MVQTHTVGFYGPFRSRSVTLFLGPTTLGEPDFRSRTLVRRRTHSDLGYLLKYTQKYTVVYLGPIRSLLDPFQVSHTIIGTPDSLGLTRTHSELGYLLKYTQKYTVVHLGPIRSLLDPFQVSHTIIGTSDSLGLTRNYPDLGYLLKYTQKYTVVYLGPIRSLLDPFQISLAIIGTSDGREGYRGQYPPPRLDLGPDGRLASTQGIRIAD